MARLLSLPLEIQHQIIKSLPSLPVVARYSQTCKEIHYLVNSIDGDLANQHEPFPPISPIEAKRIVRAQIHYDGDYVDHKDLHHQSNIAVSAMPALNSRTAALALATNEAFNLASLQLCFTSQPVKHVTPYPDARVGELVRKRVSEIKSAKISATPNYLGVRYRASQNVPDAARFLLAMSAKELKRARPAGKSCEVHPRDSFLVHEQARLVSAWFFLKLYALSEYLPPWLRIELDAELADKANTNVPCYQSVMASLCCGIEPGILRHLGVENPNPAASGPKIGPHQLDKAWEEAWQDIMDKGRQWREIQADDGNQADDDLGKFYDQCDSKCKCEPK